MDQQNAKNRGCSSIDKFALFYFQVFEEKEQGNGCHDRKNFIGIRHKEKDISSKHAIKEKNASCGKENGEDGNDTPESGIGKQRDRIKTDI